MIGHDSAGVKSAQEKQADQTRFKQNRQPVLTGHKGSMDGGDLSSEYPMLS